jgi:hypothetical protein
VPHQRRCGPSLPLPPPFSSSSPVVALSVFSGWRCWRHCCSAQAPDLVSAFPMSPPGPTLPSYLLPPPRRRLPRCRASPPAFFVSLAYRRRPSPYGQR